MAVLPSPFEGVFERERRSFDGERRGATGGTGGGRDEDEEGTLLITGGGDETVKVWGCSPLSSQPTSTPQGTPVLLKTFRVSQGGVLSLVARDGTVYAGCQDGCVAVWDLETGSMIRSISTVTGETGMGSWTSVAVRFSSCFFVVYLCES